MKHSQSGFSLLELLIAMVVVAILGTIAIPMFGSNGPDCDNPNAKPGPIMRAKIASITGEIGAIKIAADRFDLDNRRAPSSLEELENYGITEDMRTDPWGQPYVFVNLRDLPGNSVGKARKDHNLHPINTYFDIYSIGPDGKTATPITSKVGGDDIIMANDGEYFGLACLYNGSGKNKRFK